MTLLNLEPSVQAPPLADNLLDLDQAILDTLPIGVYACDREGQIIRVNRRAIELWGRAPLLRDRAQLFCGSFRLETLDGEFIPPEKTPMARAVLAGESVDGTEAVVTNPDGKRWVARVKIALLRNEAGAVAGAINCFQDVSAEHAAQLALARQQRTFDLAMTASKMGTWRYTLADNICVYDDNAQQLYGLTQARFEHDAQGVKDKFHPDDTDRMWASVAKALDPGGDGRYDVEYRVKRSDGSWRWLSAWGMAEFEGKGPARKAVAIAGASRDLTDLKRANELQKLLTDELNHRVRNTLATVHSVIAASLRGADDIESARKAVDARIGALAAAHDLLTDRNWLSANLNDIVARAIKPFGTGQIDVRGPSIEFAPKQALALSLALHELATNAAKYGALSRPEGRVDLWWTLEYGHLNLRWRESGGPEVSPPSRKGFGSRLLQDVLAADLHGESRLEFAPEGVRCWITTGAECGALSLAAE